MKRIITLLFIVLSYCANAQKESNIWYFGNQAGLDFNSGVPVVLTNGAMTSFEGVSTISDGAGNLLFYTNGDNVWNANHVIMANGSNLNGTDQSTQAALIVQQPNSNLYYIFTTDAFSGVNGFQYHIVDMSLNGGLGDLSIKNQLLYTPTNERVTACTHANGNDVWILSHQTNGNGFVAYQLTNTGLNMTPVISNAGPMFTGANLDFLGYMKFSPSGDRVAIAESNPDFFWVFDFDASTGMVSNPIQLTSAASFEGAYGVEFSPSGKVLYGTAEIPFLLYQWDLTAGNAAAINASRITIPTQMLGAAYIGSLQLGPDRKIYMTRNTCGYLGCINNPEVLGLGCNYVDSAVYLQGKTCVYGLTNLNQSFYTDFQVDDVCLGDSTHFVLDNTTGLLAAAWDFGDPGSGINNTSNIFNPAHLYTSPGVYTVSLIKYYMLYNDTLSVNVNVYSYPVINLGSDTSFCTGATFTLNAGGGYSSYLWQDASNDSTFVASVAGTYYVTVNNVICASTDTINLTEINCQPIVAFFSSDTSFCEKQCIDFFDLSNTSPTSWLWSFPGASPDTSTAQNPTGICFNNYGSFDVILIACGSLGCDTLTFPGFIHEYANPIDSIWGSNDTLYSLPFPSYQWYQIPGGLIPGATNQYFVVPNQLGSYYCVVNDSINCIGTSNTLTVDPTAINTILSNQGGMMIVPNPNNGNFEIVLSDDYQSKNFECQIIDVTGRIVFNSKLTNSKLQLTIEEGIYFLQLKNENININRKFVVKKY